MIRSFNPNSDKKCIKGIQFNQASLSQEMLEVTAGQKTVFKSILLFMMVALCILYGWVGGWVGGIILLNIRFGQLDVLSYVSVLITTIAVLTTAIFKDQARVIPVLISSFLITTIIPEFLKLFNIINLPSFYSLKTFVFLVFGLGCSVFCFIGFQFAIALAEILEVNTQLIKVAGVLLVTLAAYGGALAVIAGEVNSNPPSEFKLILQTLPSARLFVITGSILYGLSLFLSSRLANKVRNIPWSHPHWLRSFVLGIGAWFGTSFYRLDLSEVNFTRAKLANTDLRAQTLYRTCFQGVTGLERAQVDSCYLDLENPQLQQLLTHGCSSKRNFSGYNLQGAYLQNADMRGFDLTDTNLTGADLKGADLRGSTLIRTQLARADLEGVDLRTNILIDANLTEANLRGTDLRDCILVRAQVARADFSGADLTGACIEDWSASSKTTFTDVRCDYVFRQYENGQPTHRYPSDRNFEPGEFSALFQQPENELELIFKGDFSYSALSLAFYKLKTEKPELDLELKGIEQRGNLWVVHVISSNPTVEAELEQQFNTVYQTTTSSDSVETTIKDSIYRDYEEIKQRLAESQQLVKQFAGISESQAEALKQLSKQALGTNFYIEGSAITNLTGQGQIEYTEAAGQLRSLVIQSGTEAQVSQGTQQVLAHLQDIATTPPMQIELIQQILLREAENDPAFRSFLLQQQQQILRALPPGTLALAIQRAIVQLADS